MNRFLAPDPAKLPHSHGDGLITGLCWYSCNGWPKHKRRFVAQTTGCSVSPLTSYRLASGSEGGVKVSLAYRLSSSYFESTDNN